MSSASPAQPGDLLDSGAAGGKAIRGGALRLGGYLAGMVLSLISVPLMIRHLGIEDYGRYITVSSIIFIIGGFTEAGLTNLGIRDYAVLPGAERERFLRNLAGLRFALTAVGVAAATLFAWATGAETVVVQGTLITGVGLLLALSQQTYAIPLSAQLRLGWVSALDLIRIALLTAVIIACVVAGTGLLPFFVANVVSGLGVLVLTLALVRGETALRPLVDLAVWRRVLREVLPYALAAAMGLIYFRLAVILMSYVASDTETGIYSTAYRIVEVIAVIPWITVSAGFPILARAARDDADRLRYALQRLFEASTMVGAGIALVIALGAPFAIDVVAGAGAEEAVPVLRLQGIALLTSFLVATWMFALLSIKAHTALLVCNSVAAVLVAGGTLALEPSLGAEGAALATLGGEAGLAACLLLAMWRADRTLLPSPAVVWKVPLAVGAGALAALLPIGVVGITLAGGAAYVAALFALRAVPHELVNALARRGP